MDTAPDIRSDLRSIADNLPEGASYADAMYELFVRMKVARALRAAEDGRVVAHEEVKRRFRRCGHRGHIGADLL